MPRPKGITLTPAEVAVLKEWRKERDRAGFGNTTDLAGEVGVDRPHFSSWVNGGRPASSKTLSRVLRLLRTEDPFRLGELSGAAGPEVRRAIDAVRALQTTEAPRAGRGRAAALTTA